MANRLAEKSRWACGLWRVEKRGGEILYNIHTKLKAQPSFPPNNPTTYLQPFAISYQIQIQITWPIQFHNKRVISGGGGGGGGASEP